MNILVTGANGQLGSKLKDVSSQSADKYIFTDVAELDIADAAAVKDFCAVHDVDAVINCAAYTAVDRAEDEPETAAAINTQASANLAAACLERDALLIHVSTDYVFDGRANAPYTEEDATGPQGVYGKTKLDGEKAILASGCRAIIIRTSWLYSEYGNNFVKTMLRLTSEKDSVNVVFDQTGTPTYAGDLAAAIFRITEKRLFDGKYGLYHYSGEGVCSWYDLALETARVSGSAERILPCRSSQFPTKAQRPAYSVLDKTKFKTAFGLSIPYWRDSLERCLNILLNRII